MANRYVLRKMDIINVRIINDAKKSSIFDEYAVVVEHQLRGWM